jgi:hypothetical protein
MERFSQLAIKLISSITNDGLRFFFLIKNWIFGVKKNEILKFVKGKIRKFSKFWKQVLKESQNISETNYRDYKRLSVTPKIVSRALTPFYIGCSLYLSSK